MTQYKNYEFAGYTFKAYFKTAGQGFEVGLMSGNTYYFIGNFINEKEARKWWSLFNKEITSFYKKFDYSEEAPRDFYGKFMAQYLYKSYYNFLGDLFAGYNTYYNKTYNEFSKKYDKMMRTYAA